MGKEQLRHIEILKTVPEIKESIEELRQGIEVYVNGDAGIEGYGNLQCVGIYNEPLGEIALYGHNQLVKTYNITEIIGQIHEGHLRMFLDKNNEYCIFTVTGNLSRIKYTKSIENKGVYKGDFEIINTDIKLDNKKPYMEQSEEFFKKLNDWIIKEFNIKI